MTVTEQSPTDTTVRLRVPSPIGDLVVSGDDRAVTGCSFRPRGPGRPADRPRGPEGHGAGPRARRRPPARRVLRREAPAFDLPLAVRDRVPRAGVADTGRHPLRRDHQLRRAGPLGRAPPGVPGRRPGQRGEPDPDHPPVPPGHRRRRHDRRLRRRAGRRSGGCWRSKRAAETRTRRARPRGVRVGRSEPARPRSSTPRCSPGSSTASGRVRRVRLRFARRVPVFLAVFGLFQFVHYTETHSLGAEVAEPRDRELRRGGGAFGGAAGG